MTNSLDNLFRGGGVLVVALALCAGCGGASAGGGSAVTDEPAARATLTKALDAWVAGTAAADLRTQAPEIIVTDQQWASGAKLADYELVGTGQFDGKNFRFPARLTYKTPPTPGAPLKATAEFVVGLQPVTTVSRVME